MQIDSQPSSIDKKEQKGTSRFEKIQQFFKGRSSNGSQEQETKKTNGISRREFLKLAGTAAMTLAVESSSPLHYLENFSKGDNSIPNREKEPRISNVETIIVDLAPSERTSGINQNEFFDLSKIWEVVKANGYPTLEDVLLTVPSTEKIQSPNDLNNYFYLHFQKLENIYHDKLYPLVLFTYLMSEHQGHGVAVAKGLHQSEAFYGKDETPTLFPSQEIYQNVKLRQFTEKGDGWENPGVEFTITPESVIDLLQKAKADSNSEHIVFNISWQIGSQEVVLGSHTLDSARQITVWNKAGNKGPNGEDLFFVFPDIDHRPLDGEEVIQDGRVLYIFNDGLKIEAQKRDDAEAQFDKLEIQSEQDVLSDPSLDPVVGIQLRESYRKDAVTENVERIRKIAEAFPNDILVLAAGNISDDLRNIRPLPDNVIIVAEWHSGNIKPTMLVFGADLYVPNSELGLEGGSSLSVPFVVATVKEMIKFGVPLHEIKKKLQNEFSKKQDYRARDAGKADSVPEQARVLKITELKEQLTSAF